jgi:hypothetical protein
VELLGSGRVCLIALHTTIPKFDFGGGNVMTTSWNKTGTLPTKVLYVDNLGSSGAPSGERIGSVPENEVQRQIRDAKLRAAIG